MPRYRVDRPRDFGALVAGVREDRGMSQESLADRIGVARSYLSELESGKTTLQLVRLFRVLKELGVSVEVSWSAEEDTAGSDDG